ncbi:hypothetical protein OESDEN_03412 [Oesophagostomum dentatum]|uniref:Large proline-rich protein BAG6 domain-containing protein n=1 Tax=Oesophagostomum dentatum TaxID=61180 RepID=A0A0B1TKP3_OESDE|nr:hypothetical protein OESDEN_03412 [Oesophagostomum dentatum]
MFGQQTNERERVTYMIPFERSGLLEENSRIEELVRSAIDRISYITDDQRGRFNIHWDSDHTLHIALPAQRDAHVASPALERVALIQTIFEQIAHFHSVTEASGGMAERIDAFLEGSHVYDRENTAVMNDELRSIAAELDREVISRSRLIDPVGSEIAGEDETDEHEARFQRVEESEGSPGYVMRHAIAPDLVDILRRLQTEHETLRPHLLRFERILGSRILYNIDDAEHTDTDYRANFFTVYMEHLQRVIHRFSHAWHLASDLGVYLHTPLPRRLLPNYHQFRLLPPTEGQVILEFHAPQGSGPSQATTNEPTSRFLDVPPPAFFGGVDVAELTSQEVRIMGLNPTVRRMQQMGIAVPLSFPNVGHVQVPSGGPPSGAPRMLTQRRVIPFQRNGPVQLAMRQPPGLSSTASSGPQAEGRAANSQIVQTRQTLNIFIFSVPSPAPSTVEGALLDALEHAVPAAESGNPYERIMRTLLQLASDPSIQLMNVFRSPLVQQVSMFWYVQCWDVKRKFV